MIPIRFLACITQIENYLYLSFNNIFMQSRNKIPDNESTKYKILQNEPNRATLQDFMF